MQEFLTTGYSQMRLVSAFETVNHTLSMGLILGMAGTSLWLWDAGQVGAGAVAAARALLRQPGDEPLLLRRGEDLPPIVLEEFVDEAIALFQHPVRSPTPQDAAIAVEQVGDARGGGDLAVEGEVVGEDLLGVAGLARSDDRGASLREVFLHENGAGPQCEFPVPDRDLLLGSQFGLPPTIRCVMWT